MADQIFIQHRFTIEKDGLSFTDALVMPKSEYDTLSDKQKEALKQARFNDFKSQLENPPIISKQKEEQINEKLLKKISNTIDNLTIQKEELETKIRNKGED